MRAPRAGFVLLLSILTIFPSRCVQSQEAPANKPAENAAPGGSIAESNPRSRTRCEVLSCVQKVLYFSNLSQPTDLQDVTNAIRSIAEIQRVQQIIGAQIIIIEGTAEQIALAEKLAAEIDKDKRRFGGLGYRIDLKIQESEGDKKLHSRLYSFVTDERQTTRVTLERPAPVKMQSEPASDSKPPSGVNNTRNVECRVLGENERTLELTVQVEFAGDTTNEAGGGGSPPLFRLRTDVTVLLDRPTIISRIDDPDSDRSFTIELTATRIKDRS